MPGSITRPDVADDLLPQLPPGHAEADHQPNGKHSGQHAVRRWEAFRDLPCVATQAEESQPFRFVHEPPRCHGVTDTESHHVVYGTRTSRAGTGRLH